MSGSLRKALNELKTGFDEESAPPTLVLAETLIARAEHSRESVAELLYRRVDALLAQIRQDMESVKLTSNVSSASARRSLAPLLAALRNPASDDQEVPLTPLERKIQEQNDRLLGSSNSTSTMPTPGVAEQSLTREDRADRPPATEPAPGLRAAKRFKHVQGRRASRRKVQFALKNRPENPGPLNPQMLAVQILSEVQDASAVYLERLVSYLETLADLERQKDLLAKNTSRSGKRKKS